MVYIYIYVVIYSIYIYTPPDPVQIMQAPICPRMLPYLIRVVRRSPKECLCKPVPCGFAVLWVLEPFSDPGYRGTCTSRGLD